MKTTKNHTLSYVSSLIEVSLDPLVVINIQGNIIDLNQAQVMITGIEKLQAVGTEFAMYFSVPEKARKVCAEIFSNGFVSNTPITYKHKNGKLSPVLINGTVFSNEFGIAQGAIVVARNLSDIQWTPEQYVANQELAFQGKDQRAVDFFIPNYARILIEASRNPLITISADGKITDLNHAAVAIFGVAPRKLIDTNFCEYFTDPKKAMNIYKEIFTKGFVVDYALTMQDVRIKHLLFTGSVYKDISGVVLGVVLVARDVTIQKRIEKELIEAKVFAEMATSIAEDAKLNAENAVKAKQQFLSNMSHEIRTPMNAIIGFTKVLLKTDLTEKQAEYINAIKMSGDALIVLINDILDIAKVDSGKMKFESIPFAMKVSILAMLHLFESKIQEKNIKLNIEYDPRIPDVLLGDPVRLHQIILNLLSNAVKFTLKGEITVSIRVLGEDIKKTILEFAVKDTGLGIEKSKISHIFESFQQATSGTSRLYGGTGLGLAIVKQFVESQGGSVHVKSKKNIGSTFSFILNFIKTDDTIEIEPVKFELHPDIKNIKVLVVEDIPLNQLLMKTLLEDFCFEWDIASNGKIAIEKLLVKTYDVILMDLQMPQMNGFEATEYIRNILHLQIPIIALTADVTTADLAKCKAVGMNDYIAKPVDERLLYNKIVNFVKKNLIMPGNEIAVSDKKPYKNINLEYLNIRTKSNPILLMEMISAYLEQTPSLLTIMKHSLLSKDWKVLHGAVHKMIPSFAIMGMNVRFENKAKKIQEYASTNKHTEKITELVYDLEAFCNKAFIELQIEYNLLKDKA